MGKVQKSGFDLLRTNLGPLELDTPLIAASGTFGYGAEFSDFCDLDCFGAITLKAVSLEARKGNPYPRIVETPSGMLNCIGLENQGIDVFLDEKLHEAVSTGRPLIANLVGDRIDDYAKLAGILDDRTELAALEVNASCPNVDHGFSSFGTDPVVISELIGAVCEKTTKPVIAKLSPNVTDILPIARAAIDGGAAILNLGNTFLGMSICVETRKSRLSRDYAGLSGRAIRPLALRIVHQAATGLDVPIIGTGGIYETTDALEFLIAGAGGLGIGTVNFIYPNRAREMCEGIINYLNDNKLSLVDLIGSYTGTRV